MSFLLKLALKVNGILDIVVEKSSIRKSGEELFKVLLEKLPSFVHFVRDTLVKLLCHFLLYFIAI